MGDSICPLDNRYADKISELLIYFSYKDWIEYRLFVEIRYFKLLYDVLPDMKKNISSNKLELFLSIVDNANIEEIQNIEKTTFHDIKAIEVYMRKQYDVLEIGPSKYKELIHFGLTSQDINSVAFSLQLKDCMFGCMCPKIDNLLDLLQEKYLVWKKITLKALTHGQPAVPTTLGKEIEVFIERLTYCYDKLNTFKYYTKIGGAVGTLAAHYSIYPEYDWCKIFDKFCMTFELHRWQTTTQITNYEDIIELTQILIRINNILIDFCQDMWLYISNRIFILNKESSSQVGSSTMPQKVNPINFENAEGNLKLANSGFEFFVTKLAVSRLQRDLTDSTVLRSYGQYCGYMLLSLKNIMKGIRQLEPNIIEINRHLNLSPEIMSEAIQCILRKHGITNGYEIIRELTQHKCFDDLEDFKKKIIAKLHDTPIAIKEEIMALSFSSYLGYI